jgi:hypothetical protein
MLAGGVVVSDAQRSARGTRVGDIDLPAVFGSIGITRDYSRLDLEGLNVDLQGWGSEHRIFDRVLVESRPQVVMEVGTWKGASVLNMVAIARRERLTTEFICVDTWLGGDDQWIDNERRAELRLEGGYPTLFKQFVCNLVAHDATEAVFRCRSLRLLRHAYSTHSESRRTWCTSTRPIRRPRPLSTSPCIGSSYVPGG